MSGSDEEEEAHLRFPSSGEEASEVEEEAAAEKGNDEPTGKGKSKGLEDNSHGDGTGKCSKDGKGMTGLEDNSYGDGKGKGSKDGKGKGSKDGKGGKHDGNARAKSRARERVARGKGSKDAMSKSKVKHGTSS